MFSLFKKKARKLENAIDLKGLAVDMHSHLIPGVDDGSKSMNESIELIRGMHDMGYRKLYTTPHIQQDKFRNTPEILNAGLQELQRELQKQNIPVQVKVAAEYLYDDGFRSKMENGNLMVLADHFVLIELSYFNEPFGIKQLVFDLQTSGYKVILAHPERYTYWHKNLKVYEELYDRNIYLQLNINSLTGWYSEPSMQVARHLIDQKLIRFLGSDMHNQVYLKQLELSLYEPYLDKVLSSGKILNSSL